MCPDATPEAAPLLVRVVSALAASAWRACIDEDATSLSCGDSTTTTDSEPTKRQRAQASPIMSNAEPRSPIDDRFYPPKLKPSVHAALNKWLRGLRESPTDEIYEEDINSGHLETVDVPSTAVATVAFQHAAHALAEIFAHILNANCWDATFERGARPAATNRFNSTRVRRLATEHFSTFSADGWNVLIGANELARAWALPSTTDRNAHCRWLSRPTRMRLAVCLATSWHFTRGTGSSRFPRDYCHGPALNNKSGDWSFELSRIGYLFLTEDERAQLGPWPIRLVVPLQEHLLALQVELLTQNPVFSLLTENPQVEAEHRIHLLHKELLIASKIGMRARALVPLVLRALWLVQVETYLHIMETTPLSIASGALAFAGWILQLQTDRQAAAAARCFHDAEQCLAIRFLTVMANAPSERSPLSGCCAKDLRSSAIRFATAGAAEKARMLAVKASVDQAIPKAFAMGA